MGNYRECQSGEFCGKCHQEICNDCDEFFDEYPECYICEDEESGCSYCIKKIEIKDFTVFICYECIELINK